MFIFGHFSCLKLNTWIEPALQNNLVNYIQTSWLIKSKEKYNWSRNWIPTSKVVVIDKVTVQTNATMISCESEDKHINYPRNIRNEKIQRYLKNPGDFRSLFRDRDVPRPPFHHDHQYIFHAYNSRVLR